LSVLETIAAQGLDANVSLKLTQMGLDVSPELCFDNVRRIADRARALGDLFVRLDMEDSAHTEATLALHERLWSEGHTNVGVVLQAYLYRTPADAERLIALGARVRLCKGAYLEPPSVAYPHKRDVDAAYARVAERLMAEGVYPALATHDERLIRHLQSVARQRRIAPERFELQMLYGIRRDLQLRLAEQGYNVRVYLPFGDQWYPYLMRRLAERPANLAFFLASLARERFGSR
jgi:proline dehydrogenase